MKTTPKSKLTHKFHKLKGVKYFLDNAVELTKMLNEVNVIQKVTDWRMVIESAKVDRDFDNGVLQEMPPRQYILPLVRYMRNNNIVIQ